MVDINSEQLLLLTDATKILPKRRLIGSALTIEPSIHAVHQSVVSPELIQSVGRGRAICEHGIPVVVVTTEDLEYTLADWKCYPVTDSMMELTRMFPIGESQES